MIMVHKLELFISVWPLLNVWPWLSHLVSLSRTSLGWSVRISEANRERFKNHGISGLEALLLFFIQMILRLSFLRKWNNHCFLTSFSLPGQFLYSYFLFPFHFRKIKTIFWGVKLPTYNLDFLFCCGLKTLASLIILFLSCIFLISVLPTQSTERSKLKTQKATKIHFISPSSSPSIPPQMLGNSNERCCLQRVFSCFSPDLTLCLHYLILKFLQF